MTTITRAYFALAICPLAIGSSGQCAGLSHADTMAVEQIPARFTGGWLHNDQRQVMSLFARDAVFIPHDGVSPHRGWSAIRQFWFPKKGAGGSVTSFRMTVEGASGSSDRAIVWGRSDLHWQDRTTAYHWPGYYLMSLQRRRGAWLITHLVSSDEQPTKAPVSRP